MEIITGIIIALAAGALAGCIIGGSAAVIAHYWTMWRNNVARRKIRYQH